jgi:hypothetical protein
MKNAILLPIILVISLSASFGQEAQPALKKWGAEINVLWPIFHGNIYKGNLTYETWRKNNLAGDVFVGFHIRPNEFRENEGDFANYALTFGYRQFVWKGLHIEFYNAYGPGFNKNNALDGKDYQSWDYELGALAGYRWEFLKKEKREGSKLSPYLSTQHGFYYVASKTNPHPILNFTGEKPIYVGTLNIGFKF